MVPRLVPEICHLTLFVTEEQEQEQQELGILGVGYDKRVESVSSIIVKCLRHTLNSIGAPDGWMGLNEKEDKARKA